MSHSQPKKIEKRGFYALEFSNAIKTRFNPPFLKTQVNHLWPLLKLHVILTENIFIFTKFTFKFNRKTNKN
jgi:hypothetical protein